MARETGPTKAQLLDTLSEIADLAEEALDPELSREEVVGKVKQLADLANGRADDDEADDSEDED